MTMGAKITTREVRAVSAEIATIEGRGPDDGPFIYVYSPTEAGGDRFVFQGSDEYAEPVSLTTTIGADAAYALLLAYKDALVARREAGEDVTKGWWSQPRPEPGHDAAEDAQEARERATAKRMAARTGEQEGNA